MKDTESEGVVTREEPASRHRGGWLLLVGGPLTKILTWLFSTKGDGPVHDTRRAVLSVALPTAGLAIFSPFMFRFHLLRAMYFSTEKYSGRYVQIIFGRTDVPSNTAELGLQTELKSKSNKKTNTYYSVLDIYYDVTSKNYVLRGSQFNDQGDITTTFIVIAHPPFGVTV